MTQRHQPNAWAPGEILEFGPFRLIPGERRLERHGKALRIGDRALDVLLCLIANAPDVVGKAALLQQVWPNTIVEEGNIRFQINVLRRALGDEPAAEQYLSTVQGRGYSFIAPVVRSVIPERRLEWPRGEADTRLPARHPRIAGRDREISTIIDTLITRRFVTVVGSGGVGKTTLAVAAAHDLLPSFGGTVRFIDFGSPIDSSSAPAALAGLLGLPFDGSDPFGSLLRFLRDKRLLLVLDSCDHVIDAIARIAEELFVEARDVSLLLTSREPLRAEGEFVVRLPPLQVPRTLGGLDAATAASYPAIQLFVDSATIGTRDFRLRDEDVAGAADICGRLDGIPLAINLAAGYVGAFGVQGTRQRLSESLHLAAAGEALRSMPPRHRTLEAMLDWSYNLLTPPEQAALQRLSAIIGDFPIETAQAVGSSSESTSADVPGVVASLVAKSLLSASVNEETARFHLLETTRAYAISKLTQAHELHRAMRALAEHLRQVLDDREQDADPQPNGPTQMLDNVRAALHWCYSTDGDPVLGALLCAASAALFSTPSLWAECRHWTSRPLAALPSTLVGSRSEMQLRESCSVATQLIEGPSDESRAELERALEIAEALGDRPCQLRLIGLQITYCHRKSDVAAAVDLARRSALVAGSIGSDEAVALSDWLVGFSLHLAGDQVQALPYCEVAKGPMRRTSRADSPSHALDEHRIRARCGLARSLWLCGYHRKGTEEAEKTIQEAIGGDAPVTLCSALLWAAPVFAWHADWTRALRAGTELARVAATHSLAQYEAASRGLLGEMQIAQGLANEGIRNLRGYIDSIGGSHQTATATAACALAEGLLMIDQPDEALSHVVAALHLARERGGSYWLPELLRVKATIQSRTENFPDRAEATFLDAARVAEQQGAISLLLRIARTRAAYYKRRGAYEKAKQSLRSVISRFDEDQDSPALRAAKQQLAALSAYPAGEAA